MFSGPDLKKLVFVKTKGKGKNHTIGKLLFSHCSGSSQDRDNFRSSQESWLGHGSCSISHHVTVTVGRMESALGTRDSFQWSKCGGSSGVIPFSSWREQWEQHDRGSSQVLSVTGGFHGEQ